MYTVEIDALFDANDRLVLPLDRPLKSKLGSIFRTNSARTVRGTLSLGGEENSIVAWQQISKI